MAHKQGIYHQALLAASPSALRDISLKLIFTGSYQNEGLNLPKPEKNPAQADVAARA